MRLVALFAAAAVAGVVFSAGAARADYAVDPVHSSVVFRSLHAGIGHVWGRFDAVGGSFNVDEADAAKSSFTIEVKADSVNTGQEKRDTHLKSPDFFNAKQYPTITFKSTAVKKGEGNKLEVTGDMTFHGATKPVTAIVEVIGKGEFPKGTARVGIEATFTVKQSEFGVKGVGPAVGDEVKLIVALEGTAK